jgi:xylulokinase
MKLGLFFPKPEIVPAVPAGTWRAAYTASTNSLHVIPEKDDDELTPSWNVPADDARAILESQFLSMRLRSQLLVSIPSPSHPPQPARIYLVGGGSVNPAIAEICGSVLGGAEGVFRLNIGGNACALGAAHKAVWGCEKEDGEGFEDFIANRWKEDEFVNRIDQGYRQGVWEKYGEALRGFEMLESEVLRTTKG